MNISNWNVKQHFIIYHKESKHLIIKACIAVKHVQIITMLTMCDIWHSQQLVNSAIRIDLLFPRIFWNTRFICLLAVAFPYIFRFQSRLIRSPINPCLAPRLCPHRRYLGVPGPAPVSTKLPQANFHLPAGRDVSGYFGWARDGFMGPTFPLNISVSNVNRRRTTMRSYTTRGRNQCDIMNVINIK